MELDDDDNMAYNIYGLSLISRETDGDKAYYLYDGQGNVTALISSDGIILNTYYYDAFGNITEQTGVVYNPFCYRGYFYDSETGLYDLKARFYDAKMARFMQEDTYLGEKTDPLSLNLYTYCSNNPITFSDPTGHWKEGENKDQYDEGTKQTIEEATAEWNNAKTQEEKDAAHQKAEDARAAWLKAQVKFGGKNPVIQSTTAVDKDGNPSYAYIIHGDIYNSNMAPLPTGFYYSYWNKDGKVVWKVINANGKGEDVGSEWLSVVIDENGNQLNAMTLGGKTYVATNEGNYNKIQQGQYVWHGGKWWTINESGEGYAVGDTLTLGNNKGKGTVLLSYIN